MSNLKIRLYSDIHNEFRAHKTFLYNANKLFAYHYEIEELPTDSETVLVLAGDIDSNPDSLEQFLIDCSKRFRFVIHVCGNHEFYNASIETVEDMLRNLRKTHKNIWSFIDDDDEPVIIDDVAFVGQTLWTDLFKGNPNAVQAVGRGMNDFRYIKKSGPSLREVEQAHMMKNIYDKDMNVTEDPFMAEEYNRISAERYAPENRWTVEAMMARHQKAKADIQTQIDKANAAGAKSILMVTHHVPAFVSYDNNMYSHGGGLMDYGYYCTDMDDIIAQVDVCMHGHIHVSDTKYLGETLFMCNCLGYDSYEQTGFGTGFFDINT